MTNISCVLRGCLNVGLDNKHPLPHHFILDDYIHGHTTITGIFFHKVQNTASYAYIARTYTISRRD